MQTAILVGIGCVFAFVRTDDLGVWIGLGIFACLLVIFFPVTLYRLVIRRPSLVVGPDGILDSGSFIWSGVGLVHWNEILAVYPATRTSGPVKNHFLDIMVSDLPAIRRRLPFLKRLSLRNTFSGMSQLLIMQTMLETPVDDLAQQIAHYVEGHAPPGWREDAEGGRCIHIRREVICPTPALLPLEARARSLRPPGRARWPAPRPPR